jgi:hypothetical protein
MGCGGCGRRASTRATPEMTRDIVALGIALVIALVNGLAYLFVQPVWQHYDEPGHFEYIWLINNLPEPPLPDGRYLEPRTKIFESMTRNRFFGEAGPPPPHQDGMPNIGVSQLDDRPTYYLIAAAAVRLAQDLPIESQVYAARATSVFWLLATVWAGWVCACAVTPANHTLRWLTPFFVATLPAFVDLMTAVNNDAMAIGTYSLAVAFATRALDLRQSRKNRIASILAMCLSAYVAAITKSTAIVAIPVAIWVIGAAVFVRRNAMWVYSLATAVVFCIGLVLSTQYTDAHGWHRSKHATSESPTRCVEACGLQSVQSAIQINAESNAPNGHYVFQILPPEYTAALRGRRVRFTADVWTDSDSEVLHTPFSIEQNYRRETSSQFRLTQTPQTAEGFIQVSGSTHLIRILLHGSPKANIFLANLSLRPIRSSMTSVAGTTSTVETDFVRNPSGIDRAVAFNSTGAHLVDRLGDDIVQWRLALSSLQDPSGTGWYSLLSAKYIFETTWTRFGWGNIALPEIVTLLCYVASGLALLGLFRVRYAVVAEHRSLTLVMFIMSLAVTYGLNMLRGLHVGFEEQLWAAPARYGHTSIVPLSIFICAGWAKATSGLTTRQKYALFAAFMGVLNWLALRLLVMHY